MVASLAEVTLFGVNECGQRKQALEDNQDMLNCH